MSEQAILNILASWDVTLCQLLIVTNISMHRPAFIFRLDHSTRYLSNLANLKDLTPSLVVWWSEFLTTDHEVPVLPWDFSLKGNTLKI
jgi:hypothetical protein